MRETVETQIERYLLTGEHDLFYSAWPGNDLPTQARNGSAALREALVAEVQRRAGHAVVPEALADLDLQDFTRTRVAPMVRGLFPRAEQGIVLDVLARSVVFLTPGNIETVLRGTTWHHTAWSLANIYLASAHAEVLGGDLAGGLGLSEGTTCYVSTQYFRTQDPFADYLVHEAAHVFHNCKRSTIGLPATRRREWLLPIHFNKREVFAYACEVYSRLLSLAKGPAARQRLLSELPAGWLPLTGDGQTEEWLDALRYAVSARNGWKRILERCACSISGRRRPPEGASQRGNL